MGWEELSTDEIAYGLVLSSTAARGLPGNSLMRRRPCRTARFDRAALAETMLSAPPQPRRETGARSPQPRPSRLGVQCVRDELDRAGVLGERYRVREVSLRP